MSALTNNSLAPETEAIASVRIFPGPSEDMHMLALLANLRDTILVVGVQVVFRATLFLRRWNY
jgi:hypothetical protein